jgi:predicted dienelactone hydrolase
LVFTEFYFGLALMPAPHSQGSLTLPELTGPFPVGRRYLDWVDRSRRDPFHPSRPRELVISVWYPAQANSSMQKGAYLPGPRGVEAARLQSMLMRVRSQGLGSALLRNPLPREFFLGITTRAVEDAPIAIAQPVFPVLLFMPGYGAMPTEYTALLEDIASHGYIVFGITPAGFVPVTVFDDGRKIHAPLWNLSLYQLEKVFPVWVQDSRFVLDQVSEQNKDPQSPFFGHIDMSRVGVLGHSFGGAASAAACHSDARFRAGMNLDGPPPFEDRSAWKFPQPFMLVQSARNAYRSRAGEDFYKGLTNGYRVVIKGSTHHAFTDEILLPLPQARRESLVGTISGPRMVRMTSFLVSAFFDAYLQAQPSAVLDPSSQFPEILMESHLAVGASVAPQFPEVQ